MNKYVYYVSIVLLTITYSAITTSLIDYKSDTHKKVIDRLLLENDSLKTKLMSVSGFFINSKNLLNEKLFIKLSGSYPSSSVINCKNLFDDNKGSDIKADLKEARKPALSPSNIIVGLDEPKLRKVLKL